MRVNLETFKCRTQVPYRDKIYIEEIKEANEQKLLLSIKKFIKTDYITRYYDEYCFVHSSIHLPYIKDTKIRNLELRVKYLFDNSIILENKIKCFNNLPWWRRLRGISND